MIAMMVLMVGGIIWGFVSGRIRRHRAPRAYRPARRLWSAPRERRGHAPTV